MMILLSDSRSVIDMRIEDLKKTIREVPDYPKPGINFYDISTLFLDAQAFGTAIDAMANHYRDQRIDLLAGIEARGFVIAAAMAIKMEIGQILVRKKGKLPADKVCEHYELEYGKAEIEIHRDAVTAGQRVLVVDDLLATGGTAAAAGRLLTGLGADIAGYGFLVELDFLNGRDRLDADIFSLLNYNS
jgi:adenine phosphoribosyltransferase